MEQLDTVTEAVSILHYTNMHLVVIGDIMCELVDQAPGFTKR